MGCAVLARMSVPKNGEIGADPGFKSGVGADFGQYWFRD